MYKRMSTRAKGLLTLTIAAGGLLTALALSPANAWADPPGGWGRTYYGNAYQNASYNNNGGFFGRAFNRSNNCNRQNSGWFRGNSYHANNGWFGPRQVAWGGPGYYHHQGYPHRRFW